MKTNNNIPAYRFQGYTDAWELRKLGEITEKQFGGGTPTTSNALFWEGNIPWIQSSDLEEGIFSVGPRKYITKDGLGNSSAQLIPKNSIAIVTRVGVGKLAFMPFTYTTSQDFLSISYLKTNELFTIYSLYIKLQNEIKVLQGTSIKGITKNELLIKEIPIPSLPEQEAIGTFFSTLDRHITLHQRKLDKLKSVKQAYLSEMFPAEGERVPKRRFPGFTDDWELRRFSELAEIRRGLTYSPVNIRLEGIRVLRSSNIDEDTFTFGEDDVFVDKGVVKSPLVKEGDILITAANGSSRLVGKHTIIKDLPENSAIHGGFMLLASCRNPEFINSLMSSAWYTKFINLYVAGGNGAIGNLNKHDLDEQNVLVPSQKEQSAIGTFFSTLDQQITLHQRKSI